MLKSVGGRLLIVVAVLLALAGCWGTDGTPVMVVTGWTAWLDFDGGSPEATLTSGDTIDFDMINSNLDPYYELTLTIENTGDGDLILTPTALDLVVIAADANGVYSVSQQPTQPVIAPETTEEFIIRFTSDVSYSERTAQAQIATNDPNAELFVLNLVGLAS